MNEQGFITLRDDSTSLLLASNQTSLENEVSNDESMLPDNENEDLKGFINNRATHLKDAEYYQWKQKTELDAAKKATEKGDMSSAANHARLAEQWASKVKDAKYAASICNK